MVLSRKKLKQKFRSLLSESIASNESKDSHVELTQELQSVRELLLTKSAKRLPPNRRKRGKRKPLPEDLNNGDGRSETHGLDVGIGENMGNKDLVNLENGRDKKRKKGDDESEKSEVSLQKKVKKSAKKKKGMEKKREMKRKKKEGVEDKVEKKMGDVIESLSNGTKNSEVVLPAQIDESELKKVYVGGIPYYSSEDDIISFFQDCGTVTEMDCMTFPETGKFRGIAILTFKTEGAAKRALALDGADMGGFYLKIQPYNANRNQRSDFAPEMIQGYNRVYVGNLSWDISEDDLKQLFSHCKISAIRFGTDKDTGHFKGYAHVDFSDSVSLSVALELDQQVLHGRPVRIRCAVARKNGQIEPIPDSGEKKREGNQAGEKPGSNALAGTSAPKSKKKRQTCYECGTPGHISSECPQKRSGASTEAVL